MMKILFSIKRVIYVTVMVALFSCNKSLRDDHPQYFKKYFKQLDTLSGLAKRMVVLDSLAGDIHRLPAGDGDKAQFYRYYAETYYNNENYEKALLYADSILWITAKRPDEKRFIVMHAQMLLLKSDCYEALKNYDAAMKYLLQSKATLNKLPEALCKYLKYNEHTAELFYKQEQYVLAANYYKKAIQDEQQCTEDAVLLFSNIQRFYDDIGLAYTGAGLQDSAVYFFQATLDYIAKEEYKFPQKADYIALARAVVYANIAKIKRKQALYDEAENLNLVSIAGTQNDDPRFTVSTEFELADMYMERNRLDEAAKILQTLDSSFGLKDSNKDGEERQAWNLAMKKLWAKKGDTARAFIYNTRYLAIRDSLDLIDKSNISRDTGRELENRDQVAVNEMLEKENAAKTFQLVIVVLLSVLAIVIMAFVWYNLHRKAKHVKQLAKLNGEIQSKYNQLMDAYTSLEKEQYVNARITRAVAHDLRQPITRIRTSVQRLLKKIPMSDLRDVMELIKTSCNNSITLINDLITEKEVLDKEKKQDVDIQRILQYCVNILQTKADEKNQQLYLQGDSMIVPLNRQKMWRVISNILNNAIKFSPENAIINVKLEKKAHTVLLSVKDHGIGIPSELKDKIFTLHPEASRVGTAGEESHGLGLSISRRIVEEHDGKLWFESEEGKGCTFFVELPGKN